MDVRVAGRVLWRFRFVVVVGLAVALLGGLLAFVRVGFDDGFRPTFSYRQDQVWESQAILFVTQKGFPWGRSVIVPPDEMPATDAATSGGSQEQQFADASRFGTLAILYATLATSDPVRQIMLADGPIDGELNASPVLATETLDESLRSQLRFETPLPLVRLAARSDTPEKARALAARDIDAFLAYLDDQQRANRIVQEDRIVVSVLQRPDEARVVEGRSKLYAAIVFVGLALAALALPFVLENAWPRSRQETDDRPSFAPEGGATRGR